MAKITNLFDNQAFFSKKIACEQKKEAAQEEAAPNGLLTLAEDYGAKVGNNQIHATISEVMRAEKEAQATAQAEQPDYIDPDPLDWYELDSLSAKPPKKAPKTTKQPYSPRKKGGRHYGQ